MNYTKIYESPEMSVISLLLEQCIASSVPQNLLDMDKNLLYDEEF